MKQAIKPVITKEQLHAIGKLNKLVSNHWMKEVYAAALKKIDPKIYPELKEGQLREFFYKHTPNEYLKSILLEVATANYEKNKKTMIKRLEHEIKQKQSAIDQLSKPTPSLTPAPAAK